MERDVFDLKLKAAEDKSELYYYRQPCMYLLSLHNIISFTVSLANLYIPWQPLGTDLAACI